MRVSVGQVDMCRTLVCVCVCVAGIRTDRTFFFYEWRNSGRYFPAKLKSALGLSVGPLSLSFGKTDSPFFG